jgi:hypothetical protein
MDLVFTRNTVSGQVGYVPADYLDHPVLGLTLEKVPEGTKSRHPQMHAETDVSGKNADGKQVRKPKAHEVEVGNPNSDDVSPAEPVN